MIVTSANCNAQAGVHKWVENILSLFTVSNINILISSIFHIGNKPQAYQLYV